MVLPYKFKSGFPRRGKIRDYGGDLRLRRLAATGDGNSRAEKKISREARQQKKSRTKIVGSTILGNAK